ncbi:hypothetical protein [Mitsuokella sp.]|uniref:hypothetical protein n=1 Tax=Mitsuokella sp. TaxID=2049034 RepID=UPI003D7CF308
MLANDEDWEIVMKQIQEDKKSAEHYLLCYEQEMKQYARELTESMHGRHPDGNVGGGRGNLPGNPVEAQAFATIKFNEHYEPYLWLRSVEVVMKKLSKQKKLFLRLRREAYQKHKCYKGKEAWVVYVQQRYAEEHSAKGSRAATLGERTASIWWRGIVQFTIDVHHCFEIRKNFFSDDAVFSRFSVL